MLCWRPMRAPGTCRLSAWLRSCQQISAHWARPIRQRWGWALFCTERKTKDSNLLHPMDDLWRSDHHLDWPHICHHTYYHLGSPFRQLCLQRITRELRRWSARLPKSNLHRTQTVVKKPSMNLDPHGLQQSLFLNYLISSDTCEAMTFCRPKTSFCILTMQFDHLHVGRLDTSFGVGFLSSAFAHVVANLGERARTLRRCSEMRANSRDACNRWSRMWKGDRWPFR